jgi:hypothetical protein
MIASMSAARRDSNRSRSVGLWVVLPRRVVDLIEYVQKLVGIRATHGVRDQMLEGVLHSARLRVPRIEEHQHEVGQVDNVIGNLQRRGALLVGVEARGIDDDLSAKMIAVAGFELQVGIDPRPFAGGDGFQVTTHLIEGEARIGIQGETG